MNAKTPAAPSLSDLHELRDRLDGEVVLPADSHWDEARLAWNLAADQRPAAVVYAESADDVLKVVELAREKGLRVAPQGTGHFAAALSVDGTILLKTERMRGVAIDSAARTARAEAGVIWQEVADAAGEHGLAALAGTSPDVGVVGYTLGGGIGWLARRYGLAANSVVAVELVTGEGKLVRADANTNSELFWAVRGGGGSFGVVTAIELRLFSLRELYAGVLFWPMERAREILGAWREWVDTLPDDVTSVGRLISYPPIPEVPEPLRGGSFVLVEAAFLGGEEAGAELLGPLRDLQPVMDTFATMPPAALASVHMDPPQPVPGRGDGTLLADFPAEAIDALLEIAGPGSGSPLLSVEVRQLGGALSEPSDEHGAVGTIDAGFALYSVGMAMTPELGRAVVAHAQAVRVALGPWESDRTLFNFTEREASSDELFTSEALALLREIKSAADPDETIQAVHPIRPVR